MRSLFTLASLVLLLVCCGERKETTNTGPAPTPARGTDRPDPGTGGATAAVKPTPSPARPDPELDTIRELRRKGLLEEALDRVVRAREKNRKRADLWGEEGHIRYLMVTGNKGGSNFVAVQALEKAVALGSTDPVHYLDLAHLYRNNRRNQAAGEIAAKALPLAGDDRTRARAHLELGIAANMAFAQAMGKLNLSLGDKVKLQERALDHLRKATAGLPGEAEGWVYLANTWAWASDMDRERQIILDKAPSLARSETFLQYCLDRLEAMNLQERSLQLFRELVAQDGNNALAHWFLGVSAWNRAQKLRDGLDRERPDPAAARKVLDLYEVAVESYAKAARLDQGRRDRCAEWSAFALLGSGHLRTLLDDLKGARQDLFRSHDLWPAIFGKADKYGVTYANAVGEIGMRLGGGARGFLTVDPRQGYQASAKVDRKQSLRQVIAFNKELIARHPDQRDYIGFWYNNIGLAWRDLGSILAGGKTAGRFGKPCPAEAMDAFRHSYKAYQQAIAIYPDDPRMVNDCAVIPVFHLGENLEEAERLLVHAREKGLELIAAEKGSWNEARRQFLEEAVGDAWANLGRLHHHWRKDDGKAIPCIKESYRYWPRNTEKGGVKLPWEEDAKAEAEATKADDKQARLDPAPPAHCHALLLTGQEAGKDPIEELLAEAAAAMNPQDQDNYSPGTAKGIYAEAADLLEKKLKQGGDEGRLNYLLARAVYGMASAEKRSRRPNGLAIQSHLDEARKRLDKSLAADPKRLPAWSLQLNLLLEMGRTGDAAAAARKACPLLETEAAKGEQGNELTAMAGHTLYARFAFAAAKARQNGTKVAGRDGELAEKLLRRIYGIGRRGKGVIPGVPAPDVVALDLAKLLLWQSRGAEAVTVLADWIDQVGFRGNLLGELFDAGRTQAPKAVVAVFRKYLASRRNDPTLLWYLGAALSEAGDRSCATGSPKDSLPLYQESVTTMRKVIEINPAFKANSQLYIVRSLASQGWVWRALKNPEKATTFLLEALKENPDLRERQNSIQQSTKGGIDYITYDYKSLPRMRGYPKAIEVYEKALRIAPQVVDWANNMGLFARDYGQAVERVLSDEKTARKMFEKSLWAYRIAVKNEPDNPRLLNDTALIMIYHVKREIAKAEPMLHKAVKVGMAKMKKLAKSDIDTRQFLDEAVGDAWQNLGVLYLREMKDLDRAEHAFKESTRHYAPDNRRAVRRQLSNIEYIRKDIARKKREEAERKRREEEKQGTGGGGR